MSKTRDAKVLPVLEYNNPILSEKSTLVMSDIKSEDIQNLIKDMHHTLLNYGAIGLAAPQVGVNLRMLVLNVEGKKYTMINPVVSQLSTAVSFENEGCLSIPGVYKRVRRPMNIVVSYQDENGDNQTSGGSTASSGGLFARAVLHEIEHLDGKFFLDNLNIIEKNMVLKKYSLQKRKYTALAKLGV
jgi:peptide deformylase